jgi:hypothetical protein
MAGPPFQLKGKSIKLSKAFSVKPTKGVKKILPQ